MTRHTGSHSQSTTPPQMSPARRAWSEFVQPALIIGMIGAGAVVYLWACARISIIECDLRRLERASEQQDAVELELQRQLATLQTAEQIQGHIVDRGLDRPRGTCHVVLNDVPPSLYEALPPADSDRDTREIMLGELPAGSEAPLHASARLLASARTQ